jgi:hypothetical protein
VGNQVKACILGYSPLLRTASGDENMFDPGTCRAVPALCLAMMKVS